MYQAAMNGELLRFELECNHTLLIDGCNRQWGLAGVPYDIYELHDLAHADFPGRQYRLIVFVNCARISPAAAAGVRRWRSDGRVMCWTYAAGVTGPEGLDPAREAELIGIRLGWHNRRRNIQVLVEAPRSSGMDRPCGAGILPALPDASALLARQDAGKMPAPQAGGGLDFGTEGSVGPVFFADDPAATVLGRLRDGGEAAFALRQHAGWRSVYLAMLNFGPQLLRNLAAFAGAHVWCDSNDVLYANRSILCLHSAGAGAKLIRLPAPAVVTDLWTDETTPSPVSEIRISMPPYRTQAWRTQYEGNP
jgi:hypothetical protein